MYREVPYTLSSVSPKVIFCTTIAKYRSQKNDIGHQYNPQSLFRFHQLCVCVCVHMQFCVILSHE